jgi:DNA-binding IclR family transcriptional regulator
VATLAAHDLLRRTSGGVALGFGLLDLAAGLAVTVREAAHPHLQDLAVRFHETAVLAIADGETAVAVDQVVPDRRVVRIHYHAGSRHSLGDAAHGKVMLAFADAQTRRRVPSRPGLDAELAAIRKAGFAMSHDELEDGVAGLAAPILGVAGVALASIGIVAPSARLPQERDLAPAVRGAAAQITTELAARPASRALA